MKPLDHPCKNKCAGWQQGFETGVAERANHKRNLIAFAKFAKKYCCGCEGAFFVCPVCHFINGLPEEIRREVLKA